MIGLRGGAQTIVGTRTAGLDALHLAALQIASGRWERAIVGAAEEYSATVNAAYAHCGLYGGGGVPFADESGFHVGAGAVVLVLESRRSAATRRARGVVEKVGAAHGPRGDALEAIDDPDAVISCASGSRLDRIELEALRRAARRAASPGRPLRVTTLYGYLAETFSVGPLAAVAAGLLVRCLPAMTAAPAGWPASMRVADGTTELRRFGVLCADHTGPIRAVRLGVDNLPGRS
jgi:hypothetical protein